ncbi:MAG: hypothetical protein EBS87_11455, partial [Sphingomonadaceae bacterium]|nr:hypothetical protein [Sphingomonadaceae bacterium]
TLPNNFILGTNTGNLLGGVGLGVLQQTGTGVAEVTGSITIRNAVSQGGFLVGGNSLANALRISGPLNIDASVGAFSQREGFVIYAGGGSAPGIRLTQTNTMVLGRNEGLPSGLVLNLGGSANSTFDLNGFSQTVMGLERNANTTTVSNSVAGTTSTLTVNLNQADLTAGFTSGNYSGVIANGTGTVGLTKTGTGKFTLSGANTYTGPTNVAEGTLELSSTGASNVSATLITVAPTAALRVIGGGANIAMGGSLAGSGPVFIYPNQFGTAGQRDVTLNGTNTAYTGTLTLGSTDGTIAATGTTRIITTSPAQLGAANIIVKDRGQIMFNAATTFANNITITGTGFKDADTNGGGAAAAALQTVSPFSTDVAGKQFWMTGGIGALRIDGGATLSGTITLAGNAKVASYGNTGTLSGSIKVTNDTDYLVVGGLQTNNSVIQLTGTNNVGADSLNNIWINAGSSTTASYLVVGNTANTATSGTLGRGSVTLYVDGNAGQPILRFQRQDGYTLLPGQQIAAVTGGALTDLTKAWVEVETIGTGVTLNGGTIDLLLGSSNANAGIVRVGAVVNNALLNIDAGSTVRTGRFFLGEASGVAGNVNQTGGAVTVSDHLRIAHWGNNVSTYNLSGGTLTLTNTNPGAAPAGGGEQSGGVYVGVDGVGILNQSGGVLTTPWIVLDNRVSTTVNGTISQYNLTGGTLNLTQQFGLRSNNAATGVMTWSDATIRNQAPAGTSIQVDAPITVTGTGAILDQQHSFIQEDNKCDFWDT